MAKKESQKPSASAGDSRFSNFQSDPRFRLPSKKLTKTKLDKRFSRVLKDDEFTKSAKVDRYGRKLKSDNKSKALKNLYQEESEDDEFGGIDDDEVQKELQKVDAKVDPARGGGFSSSESDSASDDDDGDEDEDGGGAAVESSGGMQRLRNEQADVETGEVTNRFAIVNLDWDHIRSSDLLALMTSFVPKGGSIKMVSIYPSEFGKERMQREELEGPPKEIFNKGKDSDESSADSEDDSEDEDEDDEDIKNDLIQEGDDQDFDSDALRTYQLDRLRYYYAVVICSDKVTAENIYQAVDGTEYQTSSNFMDLRFIPDEVTFDDEPRDECDSVPADYRPTEFVTDALQHSKVKLTWDMHPEEASRKDAMKRAFSGSRAEIEENDMKAYLASSDSEADDEKQPEHLADGAPKLTKKELARQRMREALGLGPDAAAKPSKSEPVGEMEMTFSLDDEDAARKKQESANEEETTVEKYMRKEREKKARKKEKALSKREGAEQPAEEEAEVAQDGDELGFDDPFFTTEEPEKATKSSQRKEERLKKRELKEAETKKNAAERAHLEKIMGKNSKNGGDGAGHFDMAEIARAEKQKFKKGKGKKKQKGTEDDGAMQDDFNVDVGDDRFKAVFESHEYAIDPTNPKFTTTPGMKKIIGKKRGHGDEGSSSRDKKVRRR